MQMHLVAKDGHQIIRFKMYCELLLMMTCPVNSKKIIKTTEQSSHNNHVEQ